MSVLLHVGNLETSITAAGLAEILAGEHRVLSIELVMSRDLGRSRGFAFVRMANETEALAVIASLHQTEVHGRPIHVSFAKPPKSRFGGTLGGATAELDHAVPGPVPT